MKWLAAAAAAVAGIFAVAMVLAAILPSGADTPEWLRLLQTVALISFGLIPVSIGFAVFQYRLYDIDLIIRRTLTYSCLAAMLIGIYLAGVVGLSSVLRAATGRSDALAVTLSTLLVVLVSRPIQSRIKSTIDRRFSAPGVRPGAHARRVQRPGAAESRPRRAGRRAGRHRVGHRPAGPRHAVAAAAGRPRLSVTCRRRP